MHNPETEETTSFEPRFNESGLIPVVTTDAGTGEVLMLAWMNAEALAKTLETGKVYYWSRSRNRLWLKGEESGNIQIVREIRTDCDQDALLVKAEQTGSGACHTGRRTCFYRTLNSDGRSLIFSE
ncbi:MAG: phosphoribosyl-AMP cyclohydrolase [Alphaproteobacteria bacterium]|nr:phosphoribosyl-AMP cyclohydrolase [Alphaproteobacteria bacterium]